jgi:anti-sigma factor RsiW
MECRDVREMADSFLSGELLTETNHEILRHLDRCGACRSDIAARRALRAATRLAFERAPELQPASDFADGLRRRLRTAASLEEPRRRPAVRGWWALAATLALAVGLAANFWVRGRIDAELARLAAGDHRYCALDYQLAEKPITLDEAARRFDGAHRLLETVPPAEIATSLGAGRVLERHSCVYQGRRFAHVVIEYRGSVVSLLVTPSDGGARGAAAGEGGAWERQRVDSFSVLSTSTSGQAVFLVGAIDEHELAGLAVAVGEPLVRGLAGA